MTNLNLTDMETCFKVFCREAIQSIRLEENRLALSRRPLAQPADLRGRHQSLGENL